MKPESNGQQVKKAPVRDELGRIVVIPYKTAP